MLLFMSILIILAVAYAHFREGIFTAFTMLVNVVLAGVITFNFWEPLAGLFDKPLSGTFLDGFQDFLVLVPMYCLVLGLLRVCTNNLAYSQIEFQATLQQFGGGGLGLLTGYLISGFWVCALETLPWHREFIDFSPRHSSESELRHVLPADRVWLAVMRHAGAFPFSHTLDYE